FFAVGLTAVRSTPWWTLAAAPVVAGLLRSDPARPRKELPASGLNSMVALLIVVPAMAFFPWSLVGRPVAAPGRQVADAPSALTNALERVLAPGDRVFNAQIWGSWFELTLPH